MEHTAQQPMNGLIERAREASRRRDWPEAWRCWDTVRAHSPNYAPAYLGAGKALREAGRFEEAERAFGDGAELFPDDEQIALARAWLANARRDWPTALGRWDALRARFPHNPWCYVGTANALRGAGRLDEAEPLLIMAESVLSAANQRGFEAMAGYRVELEIARARLDWRAAREAAEKIIAGDAAPSALVFLVLAQACWHLGSPDEADRAALRALSVEPALTEGVIVRAWVATDRGDAETAFACYRRLVQLNPEAVRWSVKLVQLLNWFGRIQEAVSELDQIRARWPNDPMVRTLLRNYGPASRFAVDPAGAVEDDPEHGDAGELQAIADQAPGPAERLRPLLVNDPDRDVLLAEVPGAETAVLVFTGSNDSVSMPLPIFDRYLATLDATAVYLKDFSRLWFLLGIQSLSGDYHGTLAALRDMLGRLGVKRLCTIGNCDGGFAAIRYGVELRADRVLAFGPPTRAPSASSTKIEQARNFKRSRLAAHVPPDRIDLQPFLKTQGNGAQIELFYDEEDARDRMHALHLSGIPGVTLRPHRDVSHRVLRRMVLRNDDFCGFLANLLGVPTRADR